MCLGNIHKPEAMLHSLAILLKYSSKLFLYYSLFFIYANLNLIDSPIA